MLAPAMRRRIAAIAVLVVAALALAATLSACGATETSEVVEGEPIDVDGLSYNIQITRFLNPDDTEDAEYLVGQPQAPHGTSYLGVFLVVANDSGELLPSAANYTVVDTLHNQYDAVPSQSPYALQIGADVPGEGQLPIPNSTAATGPNQGSLLIFSVADDIGDNRPLTLEIQASAGTGEVILDI
jgi:hypothetical protein